MSDRLSDPAQKAAEKQRVEEAEKALDKDFNQKFHPDVKSPDKKTDASAGRLKVKDPQPKTI